MIFISNSQGNIIGSLPGSIHQGSNSANEIILLAPFTSGSVVSVAIRLPNGQYLTPRIAEGEGAVNEMAALGNFGALYNADGNSLNAWRLDLKYPITQYAGELTFSFYIHSGNVIVSTDRITQSVIAAVPYIDPEFDDSQWLELMALISNAQIAADNANTDLAELKPTVRQNTEDIAVLKEKVSTNESDIAAIGNTAYNALRKVNLLEIDVESFKDEVSRDYALKSDISTVYRFKGSVDTYADLPANAEIGDVYDVKAAYGTNPAGTNYAWNGTEWDALGGSFDTSAIASRVDALESEVTALDNKVNEVTDTIAQQFEELYDEIDRVDGDITALDDRTTANEGEIENINYILEQFGAVYQQKVQSADNLITVPSKANKVAHINSFGGMTYRKLLGFPKYTADYYNLLPYPYASITDGAVEVNGYVYNLPWEYGTVLFCNETNPITITETGTYRFKTNVAGSIQNPLFVLAYTKADGTTNSEQINANDFERIFVAGDVITRLSFGADWGSDATETFSIHPVFYKVTYYYEEDGTPYQASPDVPFEPVVYELENTKIQEFKIHGNNLMPYNYVSAERGQSYTSDGITWTVDANGWVTAKGIATAVSEFVLYDEVTNPTLPDGTDIAHIFGQVTISGCPKGGAFNTYYIQQGSAVDYGNGITVNITDASALVVKLRIANGYIADNVVFKPMMNRGSMVLSFNPVEENPTVVAIPEEILNISRYGIGVEGTKGSITYAYTNPVDVVDDVFNDNTKTVDLTNYSFSIYTPYGGTANSVQISNVLDRTYARLVGAICSAATPSGLTDLTPGSMWLGLNNSNVYLIGILDILGISTIEEFNDWVQRQSNNGNPLTLIYGTLDSQTTTLAAPFDGIIDVQPGGLIEVVTDTGAAAPFEVEFQIIGGS